MKFKSFVLMGLLVLSAPGWSADLFLGANGSTLGLGVNAGLDFGKFRVRAETSGYDYDETVELDGADYDFTLELQSTGVLVDFAPFDGIFYLSAGIFDNGNVISAVSDNVVVNVGGVNVNDGDVFVDVDFDSTAPYVGVGWNFFNSQDSGLGVNLDVGAYLNGSGKVDVYTNSPTFNALPNSEALLADEEQRVEDDIKDYDMLPVLKLGVNYKF